MGRSTNSFTAWVGQTNISGDRVEPPETSLWIAVLTRAVLDAVKGPPHLDMSKRANISHKNHYTYDRDQARHFLWKVENILRTSVKWQDVIPTMCSKK